MTTSSPSHFQIGWPGTLLASSILIPLLIEFFYPTWNLPAFTPRQILYDGNLVPLVFAPWAGPKSLGDRSSRIFLAVILLHLPPSSLLGYCRRAYPVWVLVALARTLEGFILSRGIGWVYPPLFKHWALYESASGLGPAFAVLFLLETPKFLNFDDSRDLQKRTPVFTDAFERFGYFPVTFFFTVGICWLERAPWTYGTVLLCAAALSFAWPAATPSRESNNSRIPISLPTILAFTVPLVSIMVIPYQISSYVESRYVSMPAASTSSPLLEIMVLTYPRPATVDRHAAIIHTTIKSYIPILEGQTSLSIYTQVKEHPALENAIQLLNADSMTNDSISHHINRDSYPNMVDGHYLHLSEAFRWVLEKHQVAEWLMLIEDDFPLCGGEIGHNALRQVLTILEASRPSENPGGPPRRRAGFVGTGGSGIILHRSLLPVLQLILRTYAETGSKLPVGMARRPPDIILQDCILGKDPLCPQPSNEVCPGQYGQDASCGPVITSRLIMNHIGGSVSTNRTQEPRDEWKCGWRHPFHGMAGVEAVIVN